MAVEWMICGRMLKQSMYLEDQWSPTNYCTLGIGHKPPCSFHKMTMKLVRRFAFMEHLYTTELERTIDREIAIPLHMTRKYHDISG